MDSSASATQIAVEYNGVDDGSGKLVKKSKNCQKSKNLQGLKSYKDNWFGGILPKHRSSVN